MKSKAQDPWSFALWNNLPQLSLYQFKCWALIPVSRGQDKTHEDNSKQICWKFKNNENRAVVTGGGEVSNPIGTRIDRKLKLEIHKLEFNRKEKRPWLAYKAARAWKPVSCDWNTLKSGSADSRGTAAAATATNAALLLPTVGILTLPDPPPSTKVEQWESNAASDLIDRIHMDWTLEAQTLCKSKLVREENAVNTMRIWRLSRAGTDCCASRPESLWLSATATSRQQTSPSCCSRRL